MYNYLLSILAGIIQGLTEFLPVSSSGHLVVFHDFFNFGLADDLAFDVILHLGTLAALVIYFWSELWRYLLAFFRSLVKPDLKSDKDQLLAWYLILATLPAAVTALLFGDYFENIFRNTFSVAIIMIIIGGLLIYAEHRSRQQHSLNDLNWRDALVIGIAQALALVPGISRSGITIIAGLKQNLNRAEAAHFSFLMATPIVFLAGLKKAYDLSSQPGLLLADIWLLLIGFATSAVIGFLTIKYLLLFLRRHPLDLFGYYRIIFGLFVLLFLFLR